MDDVPTPPEKDVLVVVLSKTPEKVAQFDFAARATRVKFIDIHRLAEGYNVAPEDTKDRKENAKQKADAVVSTIEKLKDPDSSEHQNLLMQCQVLGIPYDLSKIFVIVEDSTFTVSESLWPFLTGKLKRLVSDDLITKYTTIPEGKKKPVPGPGAETGPMVAAIGGFLRFYNLLHRGYHEALKKEGSDNIDRRIENQSTVIMRQLSAPLSQLKVFESNALTQPLIIDTGKDYDGSGGLIDPYAFVAEIGTAQDKPEDGKRAIANDLHDYLTYRGPRALVFHDMMKSVFSLLPETSPAAIVVEARAAAKQVTKPQPTKIQRYNQTLRERIYEVIDCEPLLKDTKSLIFKPFQPHDRLKAFYEFTSAIVAKQLIARDMFKPIVIWDDGCWESIIETMMSLANKGMAKDFTSYAQPLADTDVKHTSTSFFDRLFYKADKYDRVSISEVIPCEFLKLAKKRQRRALRKMSLKILRDGLTGYHDFIEPKPLTYIVSEGTAPDEKRFTVAHFISATSDNKTLIEQSKHLGKYLAENSIGYVWGGMNMHAGGVAFNAYKDAGGCHAAAYSTPAIAAAETEDGSLPEAAEYREWSRNIYERMAGMIAASDVIVISPGGWGTFQELLALMVLKERAPELFAGKKIVIHNPELHTGPEFSGSPFWDRSIKTLLDVSNRNTPDFTSVRDSDIFIVQNEKELTTVIDRLYTNSPKNGPSVSPQPKPPNLLQVKAG